MNQETISLANPSIIAIFGLWHQASVTAACLAGLGHTIRGTDDDPRAIEALNAGRAPVLEPGLEPLLQENLRAGRLSFSADYAAALAGAAYVYIAIDTPVGDDDEPDLSTVLEAAHQIARHASGPFTLIVTAQVPVGTTERIKTLIQRENSALRIEACYVPEFLRLGVAVDLFRNADRFVIGSDRRETAERVADLYRPFGRPIVLTDLRTAEMGKHAANAFLAASVSFINEIANICEETGADALQVAQILKLDRRIGPFAFLSPGMGFAGGTLGRDIRTLQGLGRRFERPTPIMDAVMTVNASRAGLVRTRLQKRYPSLRDVQVGVLGLTYKAGTSTMRRAISLEVIDELAREGVTVKAFDPLARLDEVAGLPPFQSCATPLAVAQGSDALVLMTEWAGIQELDWNGMRAAMRQPIFIDSRNLLDPARMEAAGLDYSGIGRGGLMPDVAEDSP
ncbi:MAG: UDP-glucose dehydrogenase family protein [Dehalococcoidia bacterium]